MADEGRGAPVGAGVPGVPGVVAVDHVGIAVRDLDEAIRFHTEVLGLVLVHRETNEQQGVAEAMLAAAPAPASPGGPVDGAAQVQLLAPLDDASPLARFLERSGPGLQQLAYRVADLDHACAELRTRGLRLLYDRPASGTRGSRINFVHPRDAGGVLLELVEVAVP
ncbi:methylmalonyl-CoA epimerase [Microlunatus flavus]|uniref:Methylmalonyl-CoA/ethylmalonyl-CoA epimerase n=1 Tax=Microlunatus flavus TaxID=1036181 RepID=A0A1H9F3H4_9ACTN|nr:methylmalonyl-CoA epimerase [Microlunatus flavus]SEQ32534.1 methylmalonyl-CoA/ethylmalonyl-CoA epimerase [Microlunatus flavus]